MFSQAVVTYRSSSPGPPNAGQDGWDTGTGSSASSSPEGEYRRTALPPQNATHRQPSASTTSPSGMPCAAPGWTRSRGAPSVPAARSHANARIRGAGSPESM